MSFLRADHERLVAFRAGDRATLAAVYRHYVGKVARVLALGFHARSANGPVHVPGLQSQTDIECGCHEVFLRAFADGARAAYDGARPYSTYLFRIARNWRIDTHRRQHRVLLVADLPEEDAAPSPNAEQRLVDRQLATSIDAYLGGVPPRDAAYYVARYREGLSQTDAAARQGLTRIQGRLIEARLKRGLLDHLRQHGYGGGA